MGGGVPGPIIGHRSVSLCHCVIFIKTGCLFLIHLQLFFPPPLISCLYSFLLPLSHDLCGYWPPLLFHCNVKNRLCSIVLRYGVVVVGDVLPYRPQPYVRHFLANGRVLPFLVLEPRHRYRNTLRYPIMQSPQIPQNEGRYGP